MRLPPNLLVHPTCQSPPVVASMVCSSVSGVFALGESVDLSSSIYTLHKLPQIGYAYRRY
jgi:hypothetical protein